MDVELARPFVKATVDVLSMMAMVTPESGKPFVKKGDAAPGDVTGLVGITGKGSKGSISLSFDKRCAVTIVKNMLGDDIQDIVQDVKDAVGEITNMISGQARAGLAEQGMVFEGGTPTVVMGDGHTITHMASAPVMSIPFTTEAGKFVVEFCFEQE